MTNRHSSYLRTHYREEDRIPGVADARLIDRIQRVEIPKRVYYTQRRVT